MPVLRIIHLFDLLQARRVRMNVYLVIQAFTVVILVNLM